MVSVLRANGYEAYLAQYKGHLSSVVKVDGKYLLMDKGSNKPGNIPDALKGKEYKIIY